jgi:hypothetical protein
MQTYPKRVLTTLALGLAISTLIIATAQAQDQSPDENHSQNSQSLFSVVEPQSKSALWINPGMASYHFDQNKNFNGANWGGGLEYRFNTVASITAGRFYNSDREYSNYAGLYYEPVAIGPIKLGAVIGGFSGYPAANNGGWFPAVLPALAWEGERVGANVFVIPTVGDRVHGAISLQLKFKVCE